MKPVYEPTVPRISLAIDGIVSIHYFEYTGSFRYSGEQHDFWEIVFCDKGPLVITAGERELTLGTGDVFIHPPMQFHNIRTDGTHSACSVIVSFTASIPILHTLADRVLTADSYVRGALFTVLREARHSFGNRPGQVVDAKLIRRSHNPVFASEQVILRELELLLIHLVRSERCTGTASAPLSGARDDKLEPILRYLEENTRRRLSVASVSREFSLSSTTLKKLFSTHLGCGVMSYFLDCRIREAKKLIREEEMNFSEIAAELGFASVHHFSRIFKQKSGMTPTEYVRSVRALLEEASPGNPEENEYIAQ